MMSLSRRRLDQASAERAWRLRWDELVSLRFPLLRVISLTTFGTAAGPPSLGDIAVAGGAQSLFWQLYQSVRSSLTRKSQY